MQYYTVQDQQQIMPKFAQAPKMQYFKFVETPQPELLTQRSTLMISRVLPIPEKIHTCHSRNNVAQIQASPFIGHQLVETKFMGSCNCFRQIYPQHNYCCEMHMGCRQRV